MNTTESLSGFLGRRNNKPLMEKRRRERINRSLNALKELVLSAENRDISKFSKLEKADILEMTVKHVKSLHENNSSESVSEQLLQKYKAGFDKCATELENYLKNVDDYSSQNLSKLMRHLKMISTTFTKDSVCVKTKSSVKIKAAIDCSVLTNGVLKFDDVFPDQHNANVVKTDSNINGLNFQVLVPDWNENDESFHSENHNNNNKSFHNDNKQNNSNSFHSDNHNFPPSPPDSSRCSSSPDSFRGSPKYLSEQSVQVQILDSSTTSHPNKHLESAENSSNSSINFTVTEQKESRTHINEDISGPLNLSKPNKSVSNDIEHLDKSSVRINKSDDSESQINPFKSPISSPNSEYTWDHSLRRSDSPFHTSSPAPFVKSEPSAKQVSNNDIPPMGSIQRNTVFLQNNNPSALSFKTSMPARNTFRARPVPYPKKDAVKRYQSQNSGIQSIFQVPKNYGALRQIPNPNNIPHSSHWRPW